MSQAPLQIVYRKPDELEAADYNPRKIKPPHLAKLKASLREFGLIDPLIVNTRAGKHRLVGGHMRWAAAKELRIAEVPTVEVDLSDEEEKALNVALNNAELAGEWDTSKLTPILEELKQNAKLGLTGFEDHQLERFKRALSTAGPPTYPLTPKLSETYDYVVIFVDNQPDMTHISELLQLRREKSYKKGKKGLGRVISSTDFIRLWEGKDREPAVIPAESEEDKDGTPGS